ncbi:hypothetical protein JCM10212_000857 [Sporobolomyces blumeae]
MVTGRTTPIARRRESSAASVADSSVQVVVRIRPNSGSDAANVPQRFQRIAVQPLSRTSLQADSAGPSTPAATASKHLQSKATFTFDRVIGPEDGQPAVYESASSLVESFLEGMNATILAYGQTSSGKSYTMGTDRVGGDEDSAGQDRLGLTPRAVADVFDRIRDVQRESKGATTFTAKVSYVEIYNEDLIDLLAGDLDVRPTVQIREDKQGNIIWSGLREVKVSSAIEVMNLLAAGSSLRQTGSTDMNAQSSRSHAIFSLTVTQRKWTGTGPLPATSAPTSPQSPRVANRLSGLPRVTSPTPGARPSTPSGRPGSRSGLRPPSQIGRPSSPSPLAEDPFSSGSSSGAESWSSITSKFHFVDLAGSERLKRTSALGDRAKEGISINAGLHALGNVISALGDPTKKATHIPYRDSKLTRLLQDSLGGNAKTMMIACVSPTEYNLHETLSTLKYANRARNIKNRAEINEVEVGWDDVEYLQRTILKLRAELSVIKSGDGNAMAAIAEEGGIRRSIDGVSTLGEAELQQKVAQLTADLAKAESGGTTNSMSRDQFERAVEPIVEEYERSLSALESQLSLTRAALGHSEDEMRDLEARVDDEVRANEASAHLIDELRVRVAKLSEREATTEAYVRDLEAKLKNVDDADESTGNAVADLRKELARNREQASTTEAYIKELEARLAKSDESNVALHGRLEALERDVERREEAYKELESRLALLDTSGEHKLLLAEIDEKDKRVAELERDLVEMRNRAEAAAAEKDRLQQVTDQLRATSESMASRGAATRQKAMHLRRPGSLTPPHTPAETDDDDVDPLESADTVDGLPNGTHEDVDPVHDQISKLREAHVATLAELEAAKAKYAESLKEIEDLHSQVQEAKLVASTSSDLDSPSPSTSPTTRRFHRSRQLVPDEDGDGEDEADEVEELAPASPLASRSGSPLMARTARSPQARRSMPLSPSHRLSFLGRGQGALASQSHSRSASLSQELSLAATLSSQISSPPSPRPVSPSPSSHSQRESWYGPSERSYEQMKHEVMQLQSVLNSREEEISALESTISELKSPASPLPHGGDSSPLVLPVPSSPAPPVVLNDGRSTPPPSRDADADLNLSPRTRAVFEALKADLSGTGLGLSNVVQAQDEAHTDRLDDLMRAMAKKESAHREAIDDLEGKLASLQRQHDDLTTLSRDQVVNMSTEIGKLRSDLEGRPDADHYDGQLRTLQGELDAQRSELEKSQQEAERTLEAAKTGLVAEHQRLLEQTIAEHSDVLARLRFEHAAEVERSATERDDQFRELRNEHEEAIRSLQARHDAVLATARSSHDERLSRQAEEHANELAALRAQHEETIAAIGQEVEATLKVRLAELTAAHSAALGGLRTDFERRALERDAAHDRELAELREQHAAALLGASANAASTQNAALDDTVAELTARHVAAVAELERSHSDATDAVRSEHEENIRLLVAEHDVQKRGVEETHRSLLADKETAHAAALQQAERQRQSTLDELRTTLAQEHKAATDHLAESHEGALKNLQADHARQIAESKASLDAELEKQRTHAQLVNEAEEALKALRKERDELSLARDQAVADLQKVRAEHGATQASLATIIVDKESTNAKLKDLSTQHDAVLVAHEEETALLRKQLEEKTSAAMSSAEPKNDNELQETLDALSTVEKALLESQQERERLLAEVQELRDAAKPKEQEQRPEYDSIFRDLEHYRASAIKLDTELVKVRKERDSLSTQLARASLSSNAPIGLGFLSNSAAAAHDSSTPIASPTTSFHERAMSPTSELGRSSPRPDSRFLPPSAPPPSMPPPAAPRPTSPLPPVPSSVALGGRSSSSSSAGHSRNSISVETAATSLRSPSDSPIDPRVAKRFEEQETQISRLSKQLSHCEMELEQTHAKLASNVAEIARLESENLANTDLINTLESALHDSERNLRKTRMNANEIVRERDQFKAENERLRVEAQDSHTTSESYRQSVLDMEERLQDQRNREARADRARQELELRMQAAGKKRSKFNCF